MGASGYTGLRTLGQVPITVAGRTSSHPAMISEEAHFDVVLGRSWIERMNVKCVKNAPFRSVPFSGTFPSASRCYASAY